MTKDDNDYIPKFIPAEELNNEIPLLFYILVDGQKIGPFDEANIKLKLESKELLYTDLISDDSGLKWMKVYEHYLFERRKSIRPGMFGANLKLPKPPSENVLNTYTFFPDQKISDTNAIVDDLAQAALNDKKKKTSGPENE